MDLDISPSDINIKRPRDSDSEDDSFDANGQEHDTRQYSERVQRQHIIHGFNGNLEWTSEYFPLTIHNTEANVGKNGISESRIELKYHVGSTTVEDSREEDFCHLPQQSIISEQIDRQMKVNVCITGYNEGFKQLLESIAGVYRSYYELVQKDESYINKVSIGIYYDGYEAFMKAGDDESMPLHECLEKVGLFNQKATSKYIKKIKDKIDYSELRFMNKTAGDEIKFETNNIGHCFSRSMSMQDFINVLSPEDRENFQIDGYGIDDYMLGSSETGHVKDQVFTHLNMDVNFVIKHLNRGKIESHLWYFKGFCQQLNPNFCFIIDAGTVALWNSISRIIFYMEAFPQVGGASGEIECMLPEKNADGSAISWIQSILMRAQYLEYKISHYSDKAAESLFGFVSVLPGAFSAFRWEAVKGDPLKAFLKGQSLTDSKDESFPTCFEANKYLAEDRIM